MKFLVSFAVVLISAVVLVSAAPQDVPYGYGAYEQTSAVPNGYEGYVSSPKPKLNGYEAYDQTPKPALNGYESYDTVAAADLTRPNGY